MWNRFELDVQRLAQVLDEAAQLLGLRIQKLPVIHVAPRRRRLAEQQKRAAGVSPSILEGFVACNAPGRLRAIFLTAVPEHFLFIAFQEISV
jgi:hypothetical protein